jgi:hypothetical protein
MSPTEIAKALLVGLTEDKFVAQAGRGWLYDAEVLPPIEGLGFNPEFDVKVCLVSPTGVAMDVYVSRPRPLAPKPAMYMLRAGRPRLDMADFPEPLLNVLTDVAHQACTERLFNEVAGQLTGAA